MLSDIATTFARRAVRTIQSDPRFVALRAGATRPIPTCVAPPDLELLLVLHPKAVLTAPYEHHTVASRFGHVLATFAGAHDGEPDLLACLFGPPLLRVDLRFIALRDAGTLSADTMLLWSRVDRLPFLLNLYVPG